MAAPVNKSTLSEYVIPELFRSGTSCLDEIASAAFDELISQAESDFSAGRALIGALPEAIIKHHHVDIALRAQGIAVFTKHLLDTFDGKGKALDIGSGIGLDSIALLKRGWSVYVVDKQSEVLEQFKLILSKETSVLGKHQVVNKDITTMSLARNNLDLILANDVLSYLSPSTLIPTIDKIYASLLPGGIFMGSILANRELKTAQDRTLMAHVRSLNAYSYTNPAAIAALFQSRGFQMEACTVSTFPDAAHPARVVSFVARKP